MRKEENNRNTIDWYMKYYHLYFGTLIYDGPVENNPIDPLAFAQSGFDSILIENIYCQQILAFLSPLQRKVALLRSQGYSVRDIAEMRGCSCQNIQRAISHTRQRLRNKGIG